MSAAAAVAGAGWLLDARLQRLMRVVGVDGDEVRVVGGAIRNTLMGLPVNDVDCATTALPADVTARARAAGMRTVPTGIEHGTVTVVVSGAAYEVTTLRRDVETDGRRAVVAFGRDWEADAGRRDFTMNALYADQDGTLYDFVGGVEDCLARQVRFIGAPVDRIREDYLRILRFFRFHAAYGHGAPDADGLSACLRERDGLGRLSLERLGQETIKLVVAPGAPETAWVMSDGGILQRLIAGAADLAAFERLHRLAHDVVLAPGGKEDWPLHLAALAAWTEADAWRLADRLRLPNAARDRMDAATHFARVIGAGFDETTARRLLYRAGERGYRDALGLAAARGRIEPDGAFAHLLALPFRWQPGRPPVAGKDLAPLGIARGPRMGDLVREAERLWIDSDFTLDRATILARLDLGADAEAAARSLSPSASS